MSLQKTTLSKGLMFIDLTSYHSSTAEPIGCDALRDLVPFVRFKKHEKHLWRSVTFSTKLTLLHGCFWRFQNCTNDTKLRNAPQLFDKFGFLIDFSNMVKEPLTGLMTGLITPEKCLFTDDRERKNVGTLFATTWY